jgi:hypothetical protein
LPGKLAPCSAVRDSIHKRSVIEPSTMLRGFCHDMQESRLPAGADKPICIDLLSAWWGDLVPSSGCDHGECSVFMPCLAWAADIKGELHLPDLHARSC